MEEGGGGGGGGVVAVVGGHLQWLARAVVQPSIPSMVGKCTSRPGPACAGGWFGFGDPWDAAAAAAADTKHRIQCARRCRCAREPISPDSARSDPSQARPSQAPCSARAASASAPLCCRLGRAGDVRGPTCRAVRAASPVARLAQTVRCGIARCRRRRGPRGLGARGDPASVPAPVGCSRAQRRPAPALGPRR